MQKKKDEIILEEPLQELIQFQIAPQEASTLSHPSSIARVYCDDDASGSISSSAGSGNTSAKSGVEVRGNCVCASGGADADDDASASVSSCAGSSSAFSKSKSGVADVRGNCCSAGSNADGEGAGDDGGGCFHGSTG